MRLKKILSLLVAMAMLFSVVGITAMAEETAVTSVTTEDALKNALAAGGTVQLDGDIEVKTMIEIPSGVTATLDLNGHNITVGLDSNRTDGGHLYALNNLGTLTLKDSVDTGSISARGIYNGYNADGKHVTDAKLTIESGTYKSLDTTGGSPIFNYGEVIINGGTFNGKLYALNNRGSMTVDSATVDGGIYCIGTLEISNSEVSNSRTDSHVIYASGSDVVIKSGTFNNKNANNATILAAGNSVVTIEDGTFSIGTKSYLLDGAEFVIEGGTFNGGLRSSNMTISGGTFYNSNNSGYNVTSATISGGTFTDDASKAFAKNHLASGLELDENGEVTVQKGVVAKIGNTTYATFDKAITAANGMTGDVTVEIYGKVEYTDSTANLTGAYDTISFAGKTADAEISITRNGSNGYISGSNQGNDCMVNFTDLILSKPTGYYADDAGFMNMAFTVYRVGSVSYTNCTFPKGACAAGCPTTYTNCTFQKSHEKYALWAYGANIIVDSCVFDDDRGIKMYAEGEAKTTALTVKNTDFSRLTGKPAIVLTYGESVTLEGNTYSSTGVFELDKDGAPNGTAVTADITDIACKNDNYADCGVLVDGKIYTTVTDAAAVATEGSTVTLMYDATETVELAEGVTLDKNGYEAANVTVAKPAAVAQIGDTTYATLEEAFAAANDSDTITLLADEAPASAITVNKDVTLDLNGKILTLPATDNYAIVIKSALTIEDNSTAQTGAVHVSGYYGIGLSTSCTGGLTVNSGKFTAADTSYYTIGAYAGKVTINGGDFTSPYCVVNSFDGYAAAVEITDGKFTVTDTTDESAAPLLGINFAVSGGTYSAAVPEEYCAEGFEPVQNEDGSYGVQEETSSIFGKAKYVTDMPTTANAFKVGLYAGIDSSNYKEVGFSVAVEGFTDPTTGKMFTFIPDSTKDIFSRIIVTQTDGSKVDITPETLGVNYRIFGQIIEFPKEYYDTDKNDDLAIYFQPYAVSLDGETTIYGDWFYAEDIYTLDNSEEAAE